MTSDPARIVSGRLPVNERPVSKAIPLLASPDADEPRRSLGAIYTPPVLADWVASLVLDALDVSPATICDLACGDGALLNAIRRHASAPHQLVGVDIDERAIAEARRFVPDGHFHVANALDPLPLRSPEDGIREVTGLSRVDAVILNPPWGVNLRSTAPHLRNRGYELAGGQFDSFDVFVELSLKVLGRGGLAAFILPDSVFAPEHEPVRRLLATESTLELVARLGEGFFEGVYRGAAVIVARKGVPDRRHRVAFLRLRPTDRQAVLRGRRTLHDVSESRTHHVPQSLAVSSRGTQFRPDVRERDHVVLRRIEARGTLVWRDCFCTGRGVELSKAGWITVCPSCCLARPLPRTLRPLHCRRCRREFLPASQKRQIIGPLEPTARRGWAPLITGEDVRRYTSGPSRQIELGVAGISYKEAELRATEKLLIRKTGVGIQAAIDASQALTTQVVYHYVPRHSEPMVSLDYLLGVVNSRVILAYHLLASGELEWRSHPYVTQSVIEALPVPDPRSDANVRKQAGAIANAVRRMRKSPAPNAAVDLEIEALVAGLYGLSRKHCAWIQSVLNGAQSLEVIRSVRLGPGCSVEPVTVA
jgi:adenine-specific DNA-methyltransferase